LLMSNKTFEFRGEDGDTSAVKLRPKLFLAVHFTLLLGIV